jgi:hypothetical protein
MVTLENTIFNDILGVLIQIGVLAGMISSLFLWNEKRRKDEIHNVHVYYMGKDLDGRGGIIGQLKSDYEEKFDGLHEEIKTSIDNLMNQIKTMNELNNVKSELERMRMEKKRQDIELDNYRNSPYREKAYDNIRHKDRNDADLNFKMDTDKGNGVLR